MIHRELLEILVCPETKQSVSLASSRFVATINEKIEQGGIHNRGNQAVTKTIEGGLIRHDKNYLYPIRDNIPIMLIEEAIPLAGLLDFP